VFSKRERLIEDGINKVVGYGCDAIKNESTSITLKQLQNNQNLLK